MRQILHQYGQLLIEVDDWFAGCMSRFPDQIRCRSGCSGCCRGLFDITLLDALYLKAGIDRLPPETRQTVAGRALKRLERLEREWPVFAYPWLLDAILEEERGRMMPEYDTTPCILLSDNGCCLAYGHRPMTCRLHGIPLYDLSGDEVSDEWCTLNFTGLQTENLLEIRHGFYDLFAQELLLMLEMSNRMFGTAVRELDTVIPAAVLLDEEMVAAVRASMAQGVPC